ncbi:MAG: helix-turn-helix domain-containing protein [Gammaproteobacteria bacterium]
MTPFSRVDVVTEADGIQSVLKAMRVFECLFKDGFSGKTIEQIHQATGIPRTTTRRLLKSFKAGGWVLERATSSGENAHWASSWKVSDKIVEVSAQYRRQVLADIQVNERNYFAVTGENLRAVMTKP